MYTYCTCYDINVDARQNALQHYRPSDIRLIDGPRQLILDVSVVSTGGLRPQGPSVPPDCDPLSRQDSL
jgi:hypothetical protein